MQGNGDVNPYLIITNDGLRLVQEETQMQIPQVQPIFNYFSKSQLIITNMYMTFNKNCILGAHQSKDQSTRSSGISVKY